jgi:hypothetical protein
MLERQTYFEKVTNLLVHLKSKVELLNPINLTDINICSENFYRDFLNLMFEYELENINIVEQNSAAIDLGDEKNRIAFQVTSTSDLSKARKTVKAFTNKKLNEKYMRLVILIITTKKEYKIKHVGEEKVYQLDTKEDIWDISTLLKHIYNLSLEKIKKIHDFLKKEIKYTLDQTLEKETQTFMSLIKLLSDDSQPSAGIGFIKEPDPEYKIHKRFADYGDFLTESYLALYTEYGQVLNDIMLLSDIGYTRIRRLALHLNKISDDILTECNGDAKKALEVIVEKYKKMLSENGIEYDEGAIRFFLIKQLIECNVFPNKEVIHD